MYPMALLLQGTGYTWERGVQFQWGGYICLLLRRGYNGGYTCVLPITHNSRLRLLKRPRDPPTAPSRASSEGVHLQSNQGGTPGGGTCSRSQKRGTINRGGTLNRPKMVLGVITPCPTVRVTHACRHERAGVIARSSELLGRSFCMVSIFKGLLGGADSGVVCKRRTKVGC